MIKIGCSVKNGSLEKKSDYVLLRIIPGKAWKLFGLIEFLISRKRFVAYPLWNCFGLIYDGLIVLASIGVVFF